MNHENSQGKLSPFILCRILFRTSTHSLYPKRSFVNGSVRRMWRATVTATGTHVAHAASISAPCACVSAAAFTPPPVSVPILAVVLIVICVLEAQRELLP